MLITAGGQAFRTRKSKHTMTSPASLQSTSVPQIITGAHQGPSTGLVADISAWHNEVTGTRVGRADLRPLDPNQIFHCVTQPQSRLAALADGTFLQMSPAPFSLHGLMVADWLAIDGIALDASVVVPDAVHGLVRWRARGERRDRRYIGTTMPDGWYTGGVDQSGRLLCAGRPAVAAGLTQTSHRRLLAGLPGLFFGEFSIQSGKIVAFNNRSRFYRTAEDLGRIAQRETPMLMGAHFLPWPY